MTDSPRPRRGRGARAGLDLDLILAAARGIPPAELTMQALADVLGVDRKALNHHVTDREGLLELLAIDAFRTRFEGARIDLGTTWQDACRGYGRAMWRAVVDIGEWVSYFRLTSPRDLAIVGPAEIVAERLLAAGFDQVTTSRGMHLLVTICQGFARDAVIGGGEGGHPQVEELRRALDDSRDGYSALRDLVDARVDNYGDEQFAFDIDAFIAGMERLLPR
jgi:AcrR family transcriptional regulator